MRISCFIDTNTFLHFRRPNEVDWREFLGAERDDGVAIVITMPVVRELEGQKVKNTSKRLRARAAESIRWLDQYLSTDEPPTIRDGVVLVLMRREPLVDFAAYHLSREYADDQLIACVLDFQKQSGSERVVLVSDDTGLRMKAPGYGVSPVQIPERYRLPEEPDPDVLRIRELEEQLRAERSRRPRLVLTFDSGATDKRIARPVSDVLTQRQLEALAMEAVEQARQQYAGPSGLAPADLVREYARAHGMYMSRLQEVRELRARTIAVPLMLANEGSAVASNVDVEIGPFPASAHVSIVGPRLDPPRPPLGSLSPLASWGLLDGQEDARQEPRRIDVPGGSVSLRVTDTHALLHVQKLKHHDKLVPPTVYVAFGRLEAVASFGLAYRVSCEENPQLELGRLNVAIDQ